VGREVERVDVIDSLVSGGCPPKRLFHGNQGADLRVLQNASAEEIPHSAVRPQQVARHSSAKDMEERGRQC